MQLDYQGEMDEDLQTFDAELEFVLQESLKPTWFLFCLNSLEWWNDNPMSWKQIWCLKRSLNVG